MNLTGKDFLAVPSENTSRPDIPAGKILSMHPVIEGDAFCWDRGVWEENLFREIQKARAVILLQTVEKELYCLCKKLCPLFRVVQRIMSQVRCRFEPGIP